MNILDGTGLEARDRRRKVVREGQAGPLPGQSLGISAPTHGLVREGWLGADGQAQERSRCGEGLHTVRAGALWSAARNCCPRELRCAVDPCGAVCIIRQHAGLPVEMRHTLRAVGRIETGHVAEQRVQGRDAPGGPHLLRRIRVKLDPPTRDGARGLSILTTLPLHSASATRVARVYRKRWTLEPAFQHLAAYFQAAINTWGYPKAALCGFGLALVGANRLAVVMAAWRSVHGAQIIDQELSLYEVANEIAPTYHGRMIAIPEEEWRVCSRRRPAEMGATLREWAQKVCLKAYRKSPRGPKKPRPTREGPPKASHVSTAKLLRERKVNATTP
ncbi:MAG TPA: hypothetical protein VIV15_05925 [Anaerolineales bacterium]